MDGMSPVSLHGAQCSAQHYEIALASAPGHAPVQSLAAIVKAFAAASERGEAIWRRGAVNLQIARVRFNKTGTRAILLLHSADADGASVSVHLVIDLDPNAGAYRTILQQAPGLTKASVEQGLQGLAGRLFEFYFKDRSGSFSKATPRLSFTAHSEEVFAIESELAQCEPEIRPDISAKLDALLRRQATKRAA